MVNSYGRMYGTQGKYEDSIKECTKALELNPVYKKILLRRAEAHEKLEHFEEAVAGKFEFLLKNVFICDGILCVEMLVI